MFCQGFELNIPISLLKGVWQAITEIHASWQPLKRITADDISCLKKEEDGFYNLATIRDSEYTPGKYVVGNFTFAVGDATYNTAGGMGSYEALCITRHPDFEKMFGLTDEEKKKKKPFTVNLPSRLIANLAAALDFIWKDREKSTIATIG